MVIYHQVFWSGLSMRPSYEKWYISLSQEYHSLKIEKKKTRFIGNTEEVETLSATHFPHLIKEATWYRITEKIIHQALPQHLCQHTRKQLPPALVHHPHPESWLLQTTAKLEAFLRRGLLLKELGMTAILVNLSLNKT